MSNERWKNFAQNMFRIGTPECAVSFGVIAMVLALLFLLLGFWQTLLIAALVALGTFIGGVKNKKEWLRALINRLFPPKQRIAYREQPTDAEKRVKEAMRAFEHEQRAKGAARSFESKQDDQP